MAASMAAFTRPDPTDRAAFEAHYQRVLSDPENTTRAIDEDGALVGMIASFTLGELVRRGRVDKGFSERCVELIWVAMSAGGVSNR